MRRVTYVDDEEEDYLFSPPRESDTIRPPSFCSRLLSAISSFFFLLTYPFREFYFLVTWIIWLFSSLALTGGHRLLVSFTMLRICISLVLYVLVRSIRYIWSSIVDLVDYIICISSRSLKNRIPRLKRTMFYATDYKKWRDAAIQLDKLENKESWKRDPHGEYDSSVLLDHLQSLRSARLSHDVRSLQFMLQHVFSRSFCHIDHEDLYYHTNFGTKYLIEEFYSRVVESLHFIAKVNYTNSALGLSANSTGGKGIPKLKEILRFLQNGRKSYGRTALCLSGGGALAMYHAGVAKSLLWANCLPSVVNGTSGGSIIAGVLATRTDAELRVPGFLDETIANRFGVRWLPTLQQQLTTFFHSRVLMDYRMFQNTARTYYGEDTFESAFIKTKRHVSITVTYAARSSGGPGGSHALVLNHITSPHVLVWSAVTASCSLPGLMEPQVLQAKDPDGRIVPFYPQHSMCLDGSLHADVPVQRLTELFNAQTFIVSQVNPHVRPFLRHRAAEEKRSFIFQLLNGAEKLLTSDIQHRLKRLTHLKVIPKVYGHDFGHIMSGAQRYTGDVNIIPDIPLRMQLKVLTHPSNDDMRHYIRAGEQAAFPHICRIQNIIIIERVLEECIREVYRQMQLKTERKRLRRAQITKLIHMQKGAMAAPPHSVHVPPPVNVASAGRVKSTPSTITSTGGVDDDRKLSHGVISAQQLQQKKSSGVLIHNRTIHAYDKASPATSPKTPIAPQTAQPPALQPKRSTPPIPTFNHQTAGLAVPPAAAAAATEERKLDHSRPLSTSAPSIPASLPAAAVAERRSTEDVASGMNSSSGGATEDLIDSIATSAGEVDVDESQSSDSDSQSENSNALWDMDMESDLSYASPYNSPSTSSRSMHDSDMSPALRFSSSVPHLPRNLGQGPGHITRHSSGGALPATQIDGEGFLSLPKSASHAALTAPADGRVVSLLSGVQSHSRSVTSSPIQQPSSVTSPHSSPPKSAISSRLSAVPVDTGSGSGSGSNGSVSSAPGGPPMQSTNFN